MIMWLDQWQWWKNSGKPDDDGELSLIALNGLDQSYDPFVTTQTDRVHDMSSPLSTISYECMNHSSKKLQILGVLPW